MEKQNTAYRKARFTDIVKYSFGGLGSNLAFILCMSYLTFFYTDIFGLSAYAVSVLMLVARVFDAVIDPALGVIFDNTRSKWGKFRPYMLFGAPLLGFSLFSLFCSPSFSPAAKLVYAYVTYLFYSLISSVVNIPYHSLTPVMSQDPVQRTVIVSWKQGMGVASQFFITVLAIPMVNAFGGGQRGWMVYGAFVAVLTTISFYLCAWGGKRYDKPANVEAAAKEEAEKYEKINFRRDLSLLLKNKPMILLMTSFCMNVLASSCSGGVNMYYFVYVLGREDLVSVVASATLAAQIIAIPVVPVLAKILGKKKLYLFSTAVGLIPMLLLLLKPDEGVAVLLSMLSAYGFVTKIVGDLGWGMLPECSDYAEWKFGKRADGLMSSAMTFFNQLGGALGGFLTTFMLGLAGYVANQPQTQSSLNMIVFLRFGLPAVAAVISIIALKFYPVTNEFHAKITEDLNKRRSI